MRRIVPILLALIPAAACKTPPQQQPEPAPQSPAQGPAIPPGRPNDTKPWIPVDPPQIAARVDSVSLERTRCYGACPAYRLVVTREGAVRFTSRDPGDEGRTASGSIDPARFGEIVNEAERIGFRRLPDRIEGSQLCGPLATDHPTAVVTLYSADGTRRVEDYRGCHAPGLKPLRDFEDRIDTLTGSSEWIQPLVGRKGE